MFGQPRKVSGNKAVYSDSRARYLTLCIRSATQGVRVKQYIRSATQCISQSQAVSSDIYTRYISQSIYTRSHAVEHGIWTVMQDISVKQLIWTATLEHRIRTSEFSSVIGWSYNVSQAGYEDSHASTFISKIVHAVFNIAKQSIWIATQGLSS